MFCGVSEKKKKNININIKPYIFKTLDILICELSGILVLIFTRMTN